MEINKKIDEVIKLLHDNEPENGYALSFSGGKDSSLLYKIMKDGGFKFYSFYESTTGESEDFIKFLEEEYPDVDIIRPKTTIEDMIMKKKYLPVGCALYCIENCNHAYKVVLKNFSVVVYGFKNVDIIGHEDIVKVEYFDHTIYRYDKMNMDCTMVLPLIKWTDEDVFNAINYVNAKLYRLYDIGLRSYSCPMCHTGPKCKYSDVYPELFAKWRNYAKYCYENNVFLRNRFRSWEEYWQFYLDFDMAKQFRQNKLKMQEEKEREKYPTVVINGKEIYLKD